MATDEYFSPSGQQQNLYPQEFNRLGQPYTPQQQQQRWAQAQAQQQMRATQYAAMKQKQQMALGARGYPQQQFNYNNFQQGFGFPGTPTQQGINIQPGTPRDGAFPNNQRDFSTPQREFNAGTPLNVPSREFSATPAPAQGTPAPNQMPSTPAPAPQRDLPVGAPQPHAFQPNRSMAGTPAMGMQYPPGHPGSRTGTPIVRPGTAMSGGGSFSDHGGQRASQPPPTPKMGMGMNNLPNGGMNIPNIPNMGMNMNMPANNMMPNAGNGINPMMPANNMGMANNNMMPNNNMGMANNNIGMPANNMGAANNMGMAGMPGANNMGMGANNMAMAGANGMGMAGMGNSLGMTGTNPMGGMNMMHGANMNANLNMPNNLNMGANVPGANNLNMGGANNLNMGGANNLNMGGANNLNMGAGNNLNMGGANNLNMPANNLNMGGANMPGGMSGGNMNMNLPGAGNMSPTKPMGLGINVGGAAPNALGMGGMVNGMGAVNGMGGMGMNGMMGMNGAGPSVNPSMVRPGVNPAMGGVNPAMAGVNPALGGVNPALGGVNPALGGVNPALGGVNPALGGVNPALGGANPALGGVNPGLPSLPGAAPTKLSRRIVSSAGPLPSSPTKSTATPALPLPAGLNPQTTLVTALPLLKDENDITHGGALPPVSETEMKDIKHWMDRDTAFQDVYARIRDHRKEEETALRTAKYAWWEVDEGVHHMPAKFHILWPTDQRKLKERRMKLLGRKDLDVNKLARAGTMVSQPELLVPIRLEIDHDHYRLRDTFTWNLNDPVITPEIFAQCLCDDFQIPSSAVVATVAKSITEQLTEHRAHIVEPASGPKREQLRGTISDKDEEWWGTWRHKVTEGTVGPSAVEDEPEFEPVEDKEKDMNEELRVLVKLDVIVGTMNLTDQLEWDINDPNNSPEEFAEIYCQDLGLGGEFKTAVAHSIREQVSVYQKSLFLVGHPFDGTPIADDELRTAMLPPIDHSFRFDRTLLEQFTPQLNVLQDGEIERNEREREKELKRKRRQTRGRRGIVLPDRDLQKTHRTPIGFAEVEVPAQQAQQQAAPVTFRRAAAAAASLTIANLAATENGTPVPTSMHMLEKERLTPVIPQQQPQPPPKQKRQRTEVLQPPPLPKRIFRARAGESMPSATTGLEPEEASAARAEFGDNAPDGPTSPGAANEAGDEDGQAAMLRRVLEKEGAESTEGLHANMIDGTWHCSNCGCPESISVGRRKGPLGQGTMCGECGKYWHKHRKPRPVEYNTSIEHHLNLKKAAKAKKRGNKGNVNNANPSPSKPSSVREEAPAAEALANGRDSLSPSPPPQKPTPLPFMDPGSPDSTIGPDSPKPEPAALPLTPAEPTPAPPEQSRNTPPQTNGTSPSPSAPPPQVPTHTRDGVPLPQWIIDCLAATQRRYTNDRIDVIAKPRADDKAPPEFRLKCLDCPGKLYTPGPEQSLTNFEVHLKNRVHRANVNRRVTAESGGSGGPAPEGRRITPSASAPAQN